MPDAYELRDGRFIQEGGFSSGVDELTVQSTACPGGKIWTILAAKYNPDCAETRTIFFSCVTKGTSYYPITNPVSYASLAGGLRPWPMLTEGTEMKLFPGEKIEVRRDVATAGSKMYLYFRFIECDLPYYSYEEPLKRVVSSSRRHRSGISPVASAQVAAESFSPERPGPDKGGGGEPQPI